jgi:hypothetical protein
MYVGNFLSVYRVRPGNDEEDCNSDDDVSDVELQLGVNDVDEALKTKIRSKEEGAGLEMEEGQDAREVAEGMLRAQAIWQQSPCSGSLHAGDTRRVEKLQEVLQAARKSRCKEKSLHQRMQEAPGKDPDVQRHTSGNVAEIQAWLAEIKTRRSAKGRLVCNKGQYQALEKIACRLMKELDEEQRGVSW